MAGEKGEENRSQGVQSGNAGQGWGQMGNAGMPGPPKTGHVALHASHGYSDVLGIGERKNIKEMLFVVMNWGTFYGGVFVCFSKPNLCDGRLLLKN